MKQLYLVLTCLFLVSWATPAQAFDHRHKLWNADLKQYVENGYVHYGAWKRNRGRLDQYISGLKSVTLHEAQSWKPLQRYAFWINAYNALVVATILDNYPFKLGSKIVSIRGMHDEKNWSIAGQAVSLDSIRDHILRRTEIRYFLLSDATGRDTQMGSGADQRVLLSISDGTITSPPLRAGAYTARRLNRQLEQQTKRVINDSNFIEVIPGRKTVKAAFYFKIYKDDFRSYGKYPALFEKASSYDRGLLRFIFHYLPRQTQDAMLAKQKSPWRFNFGRGNPQLNGGE